MRVGFTSQNFRTITGHAGRTRRFLVFDLTQDGAATEVDRLDLPEEMTIHSFHVDGPHPLDGLDLLVTKECGNDFLRRMARRGVTVVVCPEETDPAVVLRAIAEGRLDITPPDLSALPADNEHGHHHHHDHDHEHGEGGCGCGGHSDEAHGDEAGAASTEAHTCCRDSEGADGDHSCGCQDGEGPGHEHGHDHQHAHGHGHGQGRCCGGRGRGHHGMTGSATL